MKIFRKFISAAAALLIFTAAAPAYSYAEPSSSPVPLRSENIYSASSNGDNFFSSISEAGVYFRSQLKARNTSITVTLPKTSDSLTVIVNKIMNEALAETGVPSEGDYLRMAISSYHCQSLTSNTRMKLNFTLFYHSTAEQEKAVDAKVAQILEALDIKGKSDYDKVKAVYSYITSNIVYADGVDDSDIFSSYGAVVNNEAVCQGFAQLLYRMLSEAGIRNRIISGTSNNIGHAWNLADVDGKCYLMDITWDSAFKGKAYYYFLKGSDDFDSFTDKQTHTTGSGDPDNYAILPDYTSAEFNAEYPLSKTAYDPEAYKLGDIDNDGKVTAADASKALSAYARASSIAETGLTSLERKAADVNFDGKVDAIDAAYILKYYSLVSGGQNVDFSDLPL